MTAVVDLRRLTDYPDLLVHLQPRTIISEEQAETYRAAIDALTDGAMSDGQRDMVGLLGLLVAGWEAEHDEVFAASPAEVVRFLLEENGLPQAALVPAVFPTRPGVSAFLSGRRGLTVDRAVKLATFFGLSPAAFIPSNREARNAP